MVWLLPPVARTGVLGWRVPSRRICGFCGAGGVGSGAVAPKDRARGDVRIPARISSCGSGPSEDGAGGGIVSPAGAPALGSGERAAVRGRTRGLWGLRRQDLESVLSLEDGPGGCGAPGGITGESAGGPSRPYKSVSGGGPAGGSFPPRAREGATSVACHSCMPGQPACYSVSSGLLPGLFLGSGFVLT